VTTKVTEAEQPLFPYAPRGDPMYPVFFCVLADWRDKWETCNILDAFGIEYSINEETNELFITYINEPTCL
jgi:hypothetical protein